jgi:hypothetical protein
MRNSHIDFFFGILQCSILSFEEWHEDERTYQKRIKKP